MAPPRGAGSHAKSVPTGAAGEWRQVQSKGAARRAQRPQKSALAGGAAASGFCPAGGPELAAP
eukprot:4295519-Alexandrium_andersonii.AAC.1